MSDFNDEIKAKAIFKRNDSLSPSPYLKSRILAVSDERLKEKDKTFIWKLTALISSAVTIALLVVNLSQYVRKDQSNLARVNEPYVLHLTLSEADSSKVNKAEIILPEGVKFYSQKHGYLDGQRRMKLNLSAVHAGRVKLPFVVAAEKTGHKVILINLLDEDDKIIGQNSVKVTFNRSLNSI